MLVPNHEQALQQIVALKKEVSELRAKLASLEEDYHKSEGEMHAEVTDVSIGPFIREKNKTRLK